MIAKIIGVLRFSDPLYSEIYDFQDNWSSLRVSDASRKFIFPK